MSLNKYILRIRRMHTLIEKKRTGTPAQFAAKLGVSQSMLYKLLNELKCLGAPVHFCHLRQSYEYYEKTELRIGFFSGTIPHHELQSISGGARVIPLNTKNSSFTTKN